MRNLISAKVSEATEQMQRGGENEPLHSNSPTKAVVVKPSRSPLRRLGPVDDYLMRPREPLHRMPQLISPGAQALLLAQRRAINAEADRRSYVSSQAEDAHAEVRRLSELRELSYSWR